MHLHTTHQARQENFATKLALTAGFLLSGLAVGLREGGAPIARTPFQLFTLGLASFRLGRILAFEGIAQPIRSPFTETRPDESGAGATTEPQGSGARHAIGELLSCPICSATWSAVALAFGLRFLPGPTQVVIAVMSATGVAQLLHEVTENLHWRAQAARERSAV